VSRAWLGVLVSFALVCLISAPATAQNQPVFRIDAKEASAKTITKDLGSEQLHFNVSVNPNPPGAYTSQFTIRLDVSMEPVSPPNGFTLSLSAPDLPATACPDSKTCSVDVAPSQLVKFVVTVTNTVTDPDATSVTVTLKYKSTPRFTGQPGDLNPVTSQLSSGASQGHEASAKGTVGLKLDASEQVASFVKRYPLIILLAAGGIFALGVVLVRKRKGGLSVATDTPVQEVLPGRGASFPVQVTNEGGQKESLSLTTSEVPQGWSAILPVDRVELGPNETSTIWLTLKAPPTAHPGEHIQVNFVASSSDGATAESLVEAVVVERYGVRPNQGAVGAAPMPQPEPEPPMEPQVARVAPKRRTR
jgi:hypothetical protein